MKQSNKLRRYAMPVVISLVVCVVVLAGLFAMRTPEKRPLTQAEITEVNTAFDPIILAKDGETKDRLNPLSHFFTSSYKTPQEIDLFEFLWYFPGKALDADDPADAAEFEQLKKLADFPFQETATLAEMPVPVQRKSAGEVDDCLQTYAEVSLVELTNRKGVLYLEESDSFYTYTSDAGMGFFVCERGMLDGNKVSLFSSNATLTLQKQGDRYLITSHVRIEHSKPESTAALEPAVLWQAFVQEMEAQGVPYDNLHTLESSGMPRAEIMQMSAQDVRDEIANIQAVIKQNKRELAIEMLDDWEMVKNDPQFVYSGQEGTTSLHLVEDLMQSVKANDWGSITGLMLTNPIPLAYEISHKPDEDVILTTYTNYDGFKEREQVVTDLYDAGTFYHFTDNETLYFSIPKFSQIDKEILENYQPDSDLPDVPITAAQAKERATDVVSLVTGYLQSVRETHGANAMNGYGVLIPEDFDAPAELSASWRAMTDGAAVIQGTLFYQVSFYEDELFMGESYYIDAETMQTVYMVSMVDGMLIPISCGDAVPIAP